MTNSQRELKVLVKESKIKGLGVFANRDFVTGEGILTIDDTHVVEDTSMLTQHKEESEGDYEDHFDYLADGKVVLMQPPEVYINHSCEPSTYVKTVRGKRKVIAMRNVRRGDELTFDYSINGDNEGTFKCHCGSKRCRQVYQGDFFKLPRELQLEYLPYLEGWFRKKHGARIDTLITETLVPASLPPVVERFFERGFSEGGPEVIDET